MMAMVLALVLVSSVSLAQKVMLSPAGASGGVTSAVVGVVYADALKAVGLEVVTVDWGMYSRGQTYNDTSARDLEQIRSAFTRTSSQFGLLVTLLRSRELRRACALGVCRYAMQATVSVVITDASGKVLDRLELTGLGDGGSAEEGIRAALSAVSGEVATRVKARVSP